MDGRPYATVGFEFNVKFADGHSRGSIRAGYNMNRASDLDALAGLSAGAGLDLRSFRLDYAWVPFGELGLTNRVSLGFRF